MANSFKVDIITPEDTFFSGEVVSIVVPGELGYLGVLANHAPLVTPLSKGTVTVKMSDRQEKQYDMEGGFLEVSQNQATLLVEKIQELSV